MAPTPSPGFKAALAEPATAFRLCAFLFDFAIFIVLMPSLAPNGPKLKDGRHAFGWHYMFLTNVGGTVQCFYFGATVLARAVQGTALFPSFDRHLQRFFALVFPLGNVIGLIFWTTVFPSTIGRVTWGTFLLTFAQHAVTWAFAWAELLICPHKFGGPGWWGWRLEVATVVIFSTAYLAWNFVCHRMNGQWAYDFQASVSDLAVAVPAYVGLVMLGVGFYWLGWYIARRRLHVVEVDTDVLLRTVPRSSNVDPV